MKPLTKIDFHARRLVEARDMIDLVVALFPTSRNQQRAAAHLLVELKYAGELLPSLNHVAKRAKVSPRTLQRARAKLRRLGLIDFVTWMNRRHGGEEGWRLSTRFSQAARTMADQFEQWRQRNEAASKRRDLILCNLLQ